MRPISDLGLSRSIFKSGIGGDDNMRLSAKTLRGDGQIGKILRKIKA
jgi:hypothetical protein